MNSNTIDNLEPGDTIVTEPLENVTLEIHGLAEQDRGPILIEGTVERDYGDSITLYNITALADSENKFIAKPDRIRNTRVEEAIEQIGGKISHN